MGNVRNEGVYPAPLRRTLEIQSVLIVGLEAYAEARGLWESLVRDFEQLSQLDGKTLDALSVGKPTDRGQAGPGAQRFTPRAHRRRPSESPAPIFRRAD